MKKIDVLRIYRELGAINRGFQTQRDFYWNQQQYQMLILDYQNSIGDNDNHTNIFVSIVICEASIFIALLQIILPLWDPVCYYNFIFVYIVMIIITFGIWAGLHHMDKQKTKEIQGKIRTHMSESMNNIQSSRNYDDLQVLYSEMELLNEVMEEYSDEYQNEPEKLSRIQDLISNRLCAIKTEIKKRT